jgi:lipopolysaccharide assembly outer membrane protein LptD (OstA)
MTRSRGGPARPLLAPALTEPEIAAMKCVPSFLAFACLLVLAAPVPAHAQQIPGFDYRWGESFEQVDENHWVVIGGRNHLAELWQGGTKFYADRIDYYQDTHKMVAVGHVQLSQADTIISADRMEFNTETRTGVFYNAWGMASLGDRVDKVFFGGMEPDMMFEGQTVEKIGPKSYKVTRGRFTTCVQPTPRWEITSSSVIITLEHYAVLRNPIIRVKHVPVFYLPIIYYPTKKEDRATGFLLPTYGSSTLRGFTFSEAFFWAINRSQDLTLMYDWFKKTGQGFGGEYRYVRTPASQGYFSAYSLNEHEYTDQSGTLQPAKRSYQLRGAANEVLTPHLRAGGRITWFTDVVTQQSYNANILDASRSQRTIVGNLVGSWWGSTTRGSFERNEYFSNNTDSSLMGAAPRVTFSRGERPVGGLPIYFGLGAEYVNLQRGNTNASGSTTDLVSRVDVSPTVRIPFTKFPFLSVNSSVSWRGTYWNQSWDPETHAILEPSISRRLFDLQSNISGPVVNRIFDTPKSGYAEKLKHTIEPFLNLRYTTSVDNFYRIIQWESVDSIVGGVTQATYGVNNRLYAKRKRAGGAATAREILNVGISQTYYSDARASQYDPKYGTSFTGVQPYNFSPIAITARTTPADDVNATMRAEIDARYKILRTVSAAGNYTAGGWLRTSAGWSLTRFITADGLSDPTRLNNFLNGALNLRRTDNHYGGNYSLNVDVHNSQFVQQRLTLYYNAQCCGFAFDYQTYNFGELSGLRVPKDTRFNFSFTLAGIGSFSNFFGALSGAPR